MIRAIQTTAYGCKFRSRTEARWAVFFETLGIPWEYEKQGFEIAGFGENPPKWKYLPDFFLPNTKTWVEVKGDIEELTDDYLEMMLCCVDYQERLPGTINSNGTTRGLIVVSSIPNPCFHAHPHWILQHSRGVHCNPFVWDSKRLSISTDCEFTEYFDACSPDAPLLRQTLLTQLQSTFLMTRDVRDAYLKARSARFEYGEHP